MSSRALKKLHGAGLTLPKTLDEKDDETDVVDSKKPSSFSFDLLAEEDVGVDESEESEPSEAQSKPQPLQSTAAKKKKKKKKKTTDDKQAKAQSSKEDIDAIIQQYGAKDQRNDKIIEKTQKSSIFSIEAKYLDSEYELIKLFGKKTIREVSKEAKMPKKSYLHKKTLLVKAKQHWPNVPSGIGMEFVQVKNGCNYFKIVFSNEYQKAQQEFFYCVQSADPNSFQAILQYQPYHVDSLLQLSQVCKQIGEFEQAADFVERCIYAFEYGFHRSFNPLTGLCRLDFQIEENKTFFLAVFRYIQMLGREGCSRTALECCKFLLSLDPTDPMFVVFIIDYYAIRSEQYEYLLKLFTCPELQQKNLSYLPNFCYSIALAKFHLEATGVKTSDSSKVFQSSSDEFLQHAMLLFPSVLSQMMKKNSIQLTETNESGKSVDLSQHAYFTKENLPNSLEPLIKMFVERNYALWRSPQVVKWLKQNAAAVIKRIHAKDPEIQNCAAIVKREYEDNPQNIFNFLLLSEYTDAVAALPADVIQNIRQGPAQLYEGFRAAREEMATIHATTNNPLQLFLQTLMPWNHVPNAPPIDPNQPQWLNTLLQLLNSVEEPNPEDQEPPQQ